MKKLALLTNPNCGKGNAHQIIQQARRELWGWPLEILSPRSLSELQKLCGNLTPNDYEGIVVIGGDGTVHQVIKNMRSAGIRDLPLLPFPAGTANDLAGELMIRPDWEQVQALVDTRRTEWIDCLFVNGVPFTTVAGLGAGSHLTEEFNSRRTSSRLFRTLARRMRSNIYSYLSAKTLLTANSFYHRVQIQGEGFDEKLKTPVIFVCNQDRLGARLTVAPVARNDDGRFFVMIVPRISKVRLMTGLVALQAGSIPADFIVFSTDHLSVRDLDGRNITVFGDGETLLSSSHLRFATAPRSLLVYTGREFSQDSGFITRTHKSIPEEALV